MCPCIALTLKITFLRWIKVGCERTPAPFYLCIWLAAVNTITFSANSAEVFSSCLSILEAFKANFKRRQISQSPFDPVIHSWRNVSSLFLLYFQLFCTWCSLPFLFFSPSPSVPVLSSIKIKCQCLSLSSDFCALLPCLNKNHKCFYRHVLDWISLKAFNSNRLGAE